MPSPQPPPRPPPLRKICHQSLMLGEGVTKTPWAPHEGDFKFHISALWTRFAFRIITPQAAITFFS